jgi:hypothetical protein
MGRDLDLNPARYNGPCWPGTKLFRAVPCLGRAFFSVIRADPSDPAQMYTYSEDTSSQNRQGTVRRERQSQLLANSHGWTGPLLESWINLTHDVLCLYMSFREKENSILSS